MSIADVMGAGSDEDYFREMEDGVGLTPGRNTLTSLVKYDDGTPRRRTHDVLPTPAHVPAHVPVDGGGVAA